MEFFERWFNVRLLEQPMNWAIVGVVASIWLLLFHVVMQGFGAMQQSQAPAPSAAPGMAAAPGAASAGGSVSGIGMPPASGVWTDANESYFPLDTPAAGGW